jgi:hypothetical protein
VQKIIWFIIAGSISFSGLQASASIFNDCKNVALTEYLAAARSASKIGMRAAADQSLACNRFWIGTPTNGRP